MIKQDLMLSLKIFTAAYLSCNWIMLNMYIKVEYSQTSLWKSRINLLTRLPVFDKAAKG